MRDEVFRIQGAVFDVNKFMGAGFLETVYQECLAIEFVSRGIPFVASPTLRIHYRDTELKRVYVPDFVCYGAVLVEIKAVRALAPEHRAQLLNYLRATDLRVGLLVNFGSAPKAEIERFVV